MKVVAHGDAVGVAQTEVRDYAAFVKLIRPLVGDRDDAIRNAKARLRAEYLVLLENPP